MRPYPIFCPRCDELILNASECSRCRWPRPDDSAEAGQTVGEAITLPLQPEIRSHPAIVQNQIWVTGRHENLGTLATVQLRLRTVQIFNLPSGSLAHDLCAANDTLFVGSDDIANLPSLGKNFLALDGETGEIKWSYPLPNAYTLSPGAVGSNIFCFVSDEGKFYTFNLRDFTAHWPPVDASSETRFPPAINQSLGIVSGGLNPKYPTLLALELDTGKEAWRSKPGGPVSWPIAASERIICAALPTELICVDANTGSNAWPASYRPPRTTHNNALTSPPIIANSLVLFGCGDWSDGEPIYALHAVDTDSGRLIWKYLLKKRLTVNPLAVGSLVICMDDGGAVSALDLASGKLVWIGPNVGRPATVPIVLDDYLIFVNQEGQFLVIRYRQLALPPSASPEVYESRGEWSQAAVAYALSSNLSKAGESFLKAGDARHALKVFKKCGDIEGIAKSYEMLQEWDQAIEVYENTGNQARIAEVLVRAGRHGEAGEIFELLDDMGRAGQEYQEAGLLIPAARCYDAAGLLDALRELSKLSNADTTLAQWFASTEHWQLAVDFYVRTNDLETAARLCQTYGELEQAFELWHQCGNLNQCRALAQQMHDKKLEAHVCIQQGQYGEAARLFEETNHWEDALENYDKAGAGFFDHSIRALAQLGRYEEAAKRLATQGRYIEAGQNYRKQAQITQQANRELVASYWRKAAESYERGGSQADAQMCYRAVAEVLSEPILELTEVKVDSALIVGYQSRLDITIKNTGFGPASNVRVELEGEGFGYKEPRKIGRNINVLAKGVSGLVQAGLKPEIPGAAVELGLTLVFEIDSGEVKVVPFQAFLAVQPIDRPRPSSTTSGSVVYFSSNIMDRMLKFSIVRIRRSKDKSIVGMGFLVADRQVLTCAHVIDSALGPLDDTIEISQAKLCLDFPFAARENILNAHVVFWQPPQPDGTGDIAGLELDSPQPTNAGLAPLSIAENLWRHPFRAFGCPIGLSDGRWVSGQLLDREATGLIQIEDVKEFGYWVEPGFSGGPVFDQSLDAVVGMIVAADKQVKTRAAYMIPVELLAKAWNAVQASG